MAEWPTKARRGKRGFCGCGAERSTEVQIKAQQRSLGQIDQLGSISRTLCEDCAKDVFEATAELIKAKAVKADG